ncbi:Gfo/Idh/MocA family protein [Paenibacillus apiarius]|uniref:Gfo/Idh/MocA family oxidoreductase n=1 Tax=Paenibacillus apiarius TaxID=46240 RepID=A0ABT4DU09_9BACL|nr:Gfo/Idh/MocA family oxidoreductase [Paenibacillus apiarius]MCY9515914.1 Gfo/Idh/MocA family oxidoreductase [Paenibacillus apiarius]MCY9520824.1 Gfo/Idh/MocA family oxidoreductase [Paenibacillus apiarius]MCY9553529.1 Gfo/Idh/MocA family oxidoreductase [Paenibacillus apiarius]MCY9557948.1 Gfo/Idh/MocA family oxidoreductase [Paenibacillus apiarius]MCY9685803.1 Gfo/Idh/MocA family oxidoreductase [Paenibacillus apiarius]
MNTLGFSVVGFGTIAKTHMVALRTMPIIKSLPVTPVLTSLITRRPEQVGARAAQIGFTHVTTSLEEALQQAGTDVVSICTPNALHAEQVRMAMEHNKAIYCEKPVTESAQATEALLQEVPPQYPQQLAFVYRYHPAVMRIRAWLQEGIIGDVLQCKMAYMRSGYLNENRPYSWRLSDTLSGGGAITDIGVHALDLVRHWFGEFAHIEGHTETFIPSRMKAAGSEERVDVHVDDWAVMNFRTEEGVRGLVEVSRIAYGADAFRIDIVGSKGSITCDLERDKKPTLHLLNGSMQATPEPDSLYLLPDEKATMGIFQDCHFGALHHFILRLSGDGRWLDLAPSLADGYAVERWVDHVIQSSTAKQVNMGKKG